MKGIRIGILVFMLLFSVGCKTVEAERESICETEVTVFAEEEKTEEVLSVKERETVSSEEEESMEAISEKEEAIYEEVQIMINGIKPEYLTIPDYFGTEKYTPDKWEEIKQYEMNIVLDYLGLKFWQRPAYSHDELELPVDEPLGEYSAEKLKAYTEQAHDITVEYFCGGCRLRQVEKRYIALVLKEYQEGEVKTLYYQIINYGYNNVMTGINYDTYDVKESLEEVSLPRLLSGDIGSDKNMWIDEEAGEVNLIYDVGEEERVITSGNWSRTRTSYEYSLWVNCRREGDEFIVNEIIPMRRR